MFQAGPNVAFFGATGGCTIAVLAAALEAGFRARARKSEVPRPNINAAISTKGEYKCKTLILRGLSRSKPPEAYGLAYEAGTAE